jgi:hypothetical protein
VATTVLRSMHIPARPALIVARARPCAPSVMQAITVSRGQLFQQSAREATIRLQVLHNVLCVQQVTFAQRVPRSQLGVRLAVTQQKAPTFAFSVRLEITAFKDPLFQFPAQPALTV